jgi:hypothetical protein
VDYGTVLQKIVLPFFQVKLRAPQDGELFKIGNFTFKVLGTHPRSGRITKDTLISCFRVFSQKRCATALSVHSSSPGHSSPQSLLAYISGHPNYCHLSQGQSIEAGSQKITVVGISPSQDGLIPSTLSAPISISSFQKLDSITVIIFKVKLAVYSL